MQFALVLTCAFLCGCPFLSWVQDLNFPTSQTWLTVARSSFSSSVRMKCTVRPKGASFGRVFQSPRIQVEQWQYGMDIERSLGFLASQPSQLGEVPGQWRALFVLVMVSYCCDKTPWSKATWGERSLFQIITLKSYSVREGSQAGTWR